MRLANKTALVTGAGRGIGAAIARAFAREGAAVIIADKDRSTAEATAAAIVQAGGRAQASVGDAAVPEDCTRWVADCVAAFGRIDIAVNNAGVAFHRLYVDTSLADWERVLRINLTGPFLVGQEAARRMIDQGGGGRIINIGSISGQRGSTGRSAYAVAKAGIMQLTRVMAVELAAHGILVNAIAPGPIHTDVTNHGPQQTQAYIDRLPMGRYGRAEELAGAALYLASDDSQYTTGITINVDGGFGAAGLIFPQKEMKSYRSGQPGVSD